MRRPGSTAETLPVLEPQTAAQKPECKGACSPLAPGLLLAFPLKGTQGPQANKTKIKNAFSGVPAAVQGSGRSWRSPWAGLWRVCWLHTRISETAPLDVAGKGFSLPVTFVV